MKNRLDKTIATYKYVQFKILHLMHEPRKSDDFNTSLIDVKEHYWLQHVVMLELTISYPAWINAAKCRNRIIPWIANSGSE